MQVNQGDSRLLVVGSQIGNLNTGFSFDHNLCFKYPNGSCKPILGIYVPKSFQWYKESFNPMNFDPCNRLLKIWESIGIHLGVWGFILSHFPTLLRTWNVTPGLHFSPAPLQALALVVSPRLGLRHYTIVGTAHTTVYTTRIIGIIDGSNLPLFIFYALAYVFSCSPFTFKPKALPS
jgi:hypothetical protein